MKLLPAFVGMPEVNKVYHMNALSLLAALPDGCVDLIAVDWPYNGVKDEAWDNQWATDSDFLKWMGEHLAQMKRVLKPNGSYYGFASPRMAARVEVLTGEYFNVLNGITWEKGKRSYKEAFDVATFRGFVEMSERIIFAEQYGSDEHASEEANYHDLYEEAKRQKRLKILGGYLESEFIRAGVTRKQVAALFPSATGGFTGAVSNWVLGYNVPLPSQYQKMREFLNSFGGSYLERDYSDIEKQCEDVRAEYESLRASYEKERQQYESLRRPFTVTADVPYTDVWDFATVGTYAGKHPCEKPLDMMRHIVSASSRKGDLVLDCFCGSGNTLLAAKQLGRDFIGCDTEWAQVARNRLVTEFGGRKLIASSPVDDLPLFAADPATRATA